MVCDRAQVSMMYLILGQVYPLLQNILIFFFLLDYGSHFLQFTANALVKNKSHKEMNDEKENILVRFYYTNFPFFALIAAGADMGLILVFLYGRAP
jgi:phosphatidylglycerophosphate synthase